MCSLSGGEHLRYPFVPNMTVRQDPHRSRGRGGLAEPLLEAAIVHHGRAIPEYPAIKVDLDICLGERLSMEGAGAGQIESNSVRRTRKSDHQQNEQNQQDIDQRGGIDRWNRLAHGLVSLND
jgi:hypothetical protein